MTARVAIVTGASSGIGLGITRALLERRYRVVVLLFLSGMLPVVNRALAVAGRLGDTLPVFEIAP